MDFYNRKFEKSQLITIGTAVILLSIFGMKYETSRPTFTNDEFEVRLKNDYGHKVTLANGGTLFESGFARAFLLDKDSSSKIGLSNMVLKTFLPATTMNVSRRTDEATTGDKFDEVHVVSSSKGAFYMVRREGRRVYSFGKTLEEAKAIDAYILVKN